jgi:hypothetical protein
MLAFHNIFLFFNTNSYKKNIIFKIPLKYNSKCLQILTTQVLPDTELVYSHVIPTQSWSILILPLGLSIFGSVRSGFGQKKTTQPKLFFFQVFEPNRTENRFEPTMFGSVFSLPNQFKPKIISGFFHCSYFFKDLIFVFFLISQICAFCAYFMRNIGFLNKYVSFFNWLGMHDIQKFNPDFLFVRSLPKN